MDLSERLAELEQDPHGTDSMDVDALLRDAGFERYEHPGVRVYRHRAWGGTFTLRSDQREVPVQYVQHITEYIRSRT